MGVGLDEIGEDEESCINISSYDIHGGSNVAKVNEECINQQGSIRQGLMF